MNLFKNRTEEKTRFEELLANCRQCGECNAVCPVYAVEGHETASPRGRMAILRALSQGQLEAGSCEDSLETCVHCGKCAHVCPVHSGFAVASRHMAIARKQGLRVKLAATLKRHPGLARFYLQTGAALHACDRKMRHKRRPFSEWPALRSPGWLKKAPKKTTSEPRLLIYGGCMAREYYPEIITALKNLAQASGYTVLESLLPCCGHSAAQNGENKESLALARENLRQIASLDFDYFTTLCAACENEIRQGWPSLPGLDATEKRLLQTIGSKFRRPEDLPNFPKATRHKSAIIPNALLHMPCQLNKAGADSVRALLADQQGAPLPEIAACCGTAFEYPLPGKNGQKESRDRILENLRDSIALKRPEFIISACPACMRQLEKTTAQHGDNFKVRHYLQVVAGMLGSNTED